MKQLVYFLMVSLAFTALQVATVEAQSVDPTTVVPPTGAPGAPPMGDAAAKPSLGERVKSFFGMGTKDATPPTGAPVLTIGDPACATVPPAAGCPAGSPGMMGDPNMPPPTGAAGK